MKASKALAIYPLFWLTVSAGTGIVLARYAPVDFRLSGILAVFFLVAALVSTGRKGSLLLFLSATAVFQFYAQVRDYALPPHHLRNLIGEKQESGEMVLEVLDLPVHKTNAAGESRVEFTGNTLFLTTLDGKKESTGKVKVVLRGPGELKIIPGQILEIAGFWQRPDATVNPGEFDYRSYLENKRIYYLFRCQGGSVKELKPSRDPFGLIAFHLREHMLSVLKRGLEDDPQTSGLMAGMLFGYKEGISEDLEDSFRATGTLHLFAVSGQNVGVILGMLLIVLQFSGVIRWRWAWTLLPVLLFFCLATGMQSSAARAFTMATLLLSAWAIYRPTNIFNILGCAALFLWVIEPAELFDVGFQLSFFVVLGMALGTEPFLEWFYRWGRPDPWIPRRLISKWRTTLDRGYFGFCGVVAASLCAWLSSQALILYYFNLFAPVTLLANIAVMPLATVILTASVLSVVGSYFTTWSIFMNQVNWLALKVLVAVIGMLATLPGGHLYVAGPGSGTDSGELRVTLFQSRQAVPLLIQSGDQNWMLDCGEGYVWNSAFDRYRQQLGINRMDRLILTQGGADHMGAAADILDRMPVSFWTEGGYRSKSPVFHQWLKLMEERSIPKQFWRQGDKDPGSGTLEVKVLWPPAQRSGDRQEDLGLVLRFIKNGRAFLYAGDISSDVEKQLVQSGIDLKAELLIQGEHSRAGNLDRAWLESVHPRWLVRPERGFHPDRVLNPEKVTELKQLGIEIIRMEQSGALEFRIGQEGNCDLRFWKAKEKAFH